MTASEERQPTRLTGRSVSCWVLALFAAAGGILIAVGFLGALHPIFDSLAVFRGLFAWGTAGCAALLWVLGARRPAGIAMILPVLAILSLAPHWFGNRAAPEGLVLYQKNLWYRNANTRDVLADIQAVAPDFITLQEVARRNEGILDDLAPDYPTRFRCLFYQVVGDVAVLSRWPAVPGSEVCEPKRGLAAITLETPKGPVTVVSIHFHWPWPHMQPYQAEDLEPALSGLQGPVIIGGDFNMVRWSATLRRLAQVSDTKPLGASQASFTRKEGIPFGLAIDSVFATGGTGETSLRPLFGSDHKGILARIALP